MAAVIADQHASIDVDPATGFPRRVSRWVWAATIAFFVASYGFMFSFAHPLVDTRACLLTLPDPLLRLIPRMPVFFLVTHQIYYVFTFGGAFALGLRAYQGDHGPFLRFGIALSLQALLRSATLSLLPLCEPLVPAGTIALDHVPTLALGPWHIPWRLWANNDLVFSGHVGEFLILYWASSHWPRWARRTLLVFQIVQAFGLLATRAHYTIDLLLAVPCAFFVDGLAAAAVRALSGRTKPVWHTPT